MELTNNYKIISEVHTTHSLFPTHPSFFPRNIEFNIVSMGKLENFKQMKV